MVKFHHRRLAIFTFMLVFGAGMSSWIVRTPAMRDLLTASTAEMGIVLLGLSTGSMAGVLSSARMVRRHGVRFTVLIGGSSFTAGITMIGVFAGLSAYEGVFAGLALVGFGVGVSEIALNIEGAALEASLGKPVIPALHGCWSLGTVLGAVAGIASTAIDLSVTWQLTLVAVISGALLALVLRFVPSTTGRVVRLPKESGAVALRTSLSNVWAQPRLLILGLIVLALALAEGAAMDWLPLLMVDDHGTTATQGSAIFAGFAAAMAVGRFLGGPLLRRFSRSSVLRSSTLVSAAGIALVIFADNLVVAVMAVALWGAGAALGFPVALSAAADSDDPTASVAAVATVGYVAFLVGPPLLGFLGQEFDLRGAMVVVLITVTLASFLAPAARRRSEDRLREAAVDVESPTE